MQDERTDGELDPFMEELICFVIIQGEITAVPNCQTLSELERASLICALNIGRT